MAKRRYYKLGEKALSFYCPITKLKLANNNPGFFDGNLESKKVRTARLAGHIIEIKEAEYADLKAKAELQTKVASTPAPAPVASTKTPEELEKDIKLMNKPELLVKAESLGIPEDQYKKANKDVLIALIEEKLESEEEDEEDDDDDEDQ